MRVPKQSLGSCRLVSWTGRVGILLPWSISRVRRITVSDAGHGVAEGVIDVNPERYPDQEYQTCQKLNGAHLITSSDQERRPGGRTLSRYHVNLSTLLLR
jgi:hypothetical protein